MGPPQILDLIQLQDGFQSLIAQAQPDHVAAFFYWLDLKVAQFKVFGSCLSQEADYSPVKMRQFTASSTPYNGACPPEHEFVTDLSTAPRDQNGMCNGTNGRLHPDKPASYTVPPTLSFEEPIVPASTLQEFCETAADGLNGSRTVKSLLRAMLAKPKNNDPVVDSEVKHEQDSAAEDVPESFAALDAKDDDVDSQSANDSFIRDDPMSVESESEAPACHGNSSAAEGGSDVVGEKASRCPYCLKVFRYRSSYRRHIKIHEGVFSHECTVCMRKFTRKEHFLRHKCDRRPNKPYHITHEVFRRLTPSEKAAMRQAPEMFGPPMSIIKSRTDASAISVADTPLELTSHVPSSANSEIQDQSTVTLTQPINIPLPVMFCSIPGSGPLVDASAAALMSMATAPLRSVSFASELSNLEGFSLHHNESRRKSSTPRKVIALKSKTSFDGESCETNSGGVGFPRDLNGHSSLSVAAV